MWLLCSTFRRLKASLPAFVENRMNRRFQWQHLAGTGVAAALVTVAAPAASAQSTAPTSVMKACWVEGSGVIYRRDTTGAPTGCQQSTHRAIEWTLGLVPMGNGGLTAVPVPLNLFGTADTGPILNLGNNGNGQALIAQSSGSTAVALFQRSSGTGATVRMTNTATGDGLNSVLRVEQSANSAAADISSTGTGQALLARNNSTVQATVVGLNAATSGSGAFFGDSKGTGPTADFRNSGSANGGALNARSAGNATTATIYSDGTANANAIYAESKGQWTTVDFRNTGAANGGAIRASSNSSGCSVCLYNDNTGSGNALYAEGKGTGYAVGINNITGTGGALNGFSNASFTTAYFGNDATSGNARAIFANSKGGSPTITATNTGSANGAAIQGLSQGQNFTGDFRNTGSGGSVYALSQGTSHTIIGSNTGTTGGAALFDNNSATGNTVSITAKGGSTALFARSSNQNGVWFDNVGTGNNIGILGTSIGVWPTAQFENRAGGPSLYAIGRAQIDGNVLVNGSLQINGNYVATGTKNAVVPTSTGTREMYTEEATEVWFADYGQAMLADSVVWVPFDATFAETIESDRPYHVFLQAYADASIYVSRRTTDGFEVRVRGERAASEPIEFSYRLVAKRKGYGDRRLRAHTLQKHESGSRGGNN
jgi:hypothetical protein